MQGQEEIRVEQVNEQPSCCCDGECAFVDGFDAAAPQERFESEKPSYYMPCC